MSEDKPTPKVNISKEEAELIIRFRVNAFNEILESIMKLDADAVISGNGKISKRKHELGALYDMLDEINEMFSLTWSRYTFHVSRGQVEKNDKDS